MGHVTLTFLRGGWIKTLHLMTVTHESLVILNLFRTMIDVDRATVIDTAVLGTVLT